MKGKRSIGERLLRNTGTLFGLIVIGAAIFVAITAYLIAPDASPDANRIIVEIGGRKPGFRQEFLLVKKTGVAPVGVFHRLLYGREDPYDYVPISGFIRTGDSIYVQKFVDEGVFEFKAYAGGTAPIVETRRFWLGTDKYGRDILSRLLIGVRVSLPVGLGAVVLSVSVGVLLQALAGY